jgi:dTDP-4-amino-4,6-dideoxygalactose transaminase
MSGFEQKYIQEAFDTNWVAPVGANLDRFEQDLENYLNQDVFVGALSSGTAALHLGLILLGVQTGDEVICQSMTFSASANPILYQGAIPIFIDSESDTWNMCPFALEEAILDRITKGKKPKAIIPVHLYGMPANMEAIIAIASRYEIPILEDSAEALGSSYKGQKCGTFGTFGALSFNGNKIITTSGGGALVTKSKKIKERIVFFATQSRDNAPHYQHSEIGYNYRMSNICAGIGRGQMEVLDDRIALRRKMNAFYIEFFKSVQGVTVLKEPNPDFFSNHWLSAIVIDEAKVGKNREDLRLAFEAANIESRPLWKPMHLQPIFEKYPYYGKQVAEQLFNEGLCLPSGSNLSENEKARIEKSLLLFFNS